MTKRTILYLLLTMLLLIPTTVVAQGPIQPEHTDPRWTAMYWDNPDQLGNAVLIRAEEELHHVWGTGSPHADVPDDGFSAQWTRYIDVTPGNYRFIVASDDGVRLWIDGELLLDEWNDHAEETFYVDTQLDAGHHEIEVDYYENQGLATIKMSWMRVDQAVGPWRAEYYNNMTLSGTPILIRRESEVDFNWATGSPDTNIINANHFSARWSRTLDSLPAGTYRFELTVDDGARLWVNGHLLIDAWFDQAATTYTEDIYLGEGPITLELQYYENEGYARAELDWNPPRSDLPTSDMVIVDNEDATGFVQGGSGQSWRTAREGYGDSLNWTFNNEAVQANYNWARWYPELAAGEYTVSVYIPFRYSTTAQARYWVAHAQGLSLHVVDQSQNGGQWVTLGTYQFRGDGSEYVSLADVTFEPPQDRIVAFDAVRWVAE